jgi:hypothetical protein
MESEGHGNIIGTTFAELCKAVEYDTLVVVGLGDGTNEAVVIQDARSNEKNVFCVDPDPGSYANRSPQETVSYATLGDLLEDHPGLADDTARVVLVIIWPPPQSPKNAGPAPAHLPYCDSTHDAEALNTLSPLGVLALYSPDGSSGSREFVDLIDDYGKPVSVSKGKYGRGFGLAGQQIRIVARARGYEGPVGGVGTVKFDATGIIRSMAVNLVSVGLHKRMPQVLAMWDSQLTENEKEKLIMAVHAVVEETKKSSKQ